MNEGYHEYYLCGDRSLESELRDNFFKKQQFEFPPEHLRERMLEISEIMNVPDPYYISVFTTNTNDVFDYRVEITTSFNKKHLFEFEEIGLEFDSVNPRGESIVLYLKEKKNDA